MNLKGISKHELLTKTETLVREERRITTEILWHLFEIERRRLFAELGYGSLFDYCTKDLKYSAGSAQRRIAAMRLLKELPEIESKISSGELNVAAISQAQSVFRSARAENKAFSLEAKRELIQRLENKTHRECEKILADINPTASRPSLERAVSHNRTEIRFEVDDALYAGIQKLKGYYAQKLKGSADIKDLMELLVEQALEDVEPRVKKQTKKDLLPALEVERKNSTNPATATGRNRYINKATRVGAWRKADGQCSFISPLTGKRCTSHYAPEYDHRIPRAKGGTTTTNNIRLLCKTHNQLVAIQHFGLAKMERYLSPSI